MAAQAHTRRDYTANYNIVEGPPAFFCRRRRHRAVGRIIIISSSSSSCIYVCFVSVDGRVISIHHHHHYCDIKTSARIRYAYTRINILNANMWNIRARTHILSNVDNSIFFFVVLYIVCYLFLYFCLLFFLCVKNNRGKLKKKLSHQNVNHAQYKCRANARQDDD